MQDFSQGDLNVCFRSHCGLYPAGNEARSDVVTDDEKTQILHG